MEKYTVNGEISVSAPEGFQLMTAEELTKLFVSGDPSRWGLWDRERHVMLIVEWKKYSRLMLALSDIKSVAKRNETLSRKAYAANDYELEEFVSGTIGGRQAEGYRFSFRVEDTEQGAEVRLLRQGNFIYRFTVNGRGANREVNRELFKNFLDTVTFI